jgi:hypothetical protein
VLASAIALTILIGSATLTAVRAADMTPAEIKTIAEEGFILSSALLPGVADSCTS